MPTDPVVLRRDVVAKDTFGQHDMVLTTQHESKATPEGNPVEDDLKDFDLWIAKECVSVLLRTYPGYPWAVESDSAQGIVKISIPILMGVANWYVINLKETQLSPGAVVYGGGELLERYGQKRGRMQLAAFLDARKQHSALVVPARHVPG